jgi:hypothetical protein
MSHDRPGGLLSCIVGLSASMAVAIPASAQEGDEGIRLDYRPSAGCPDESAFVTRILARTSRARLARPSEAARRFLVVLDAGPPASGTVAIEAVAEEGEGIRSVRAATCVDAADALALVVALAVDPHAGSPRPPAPTRALIPAAPSSTPVARPPAGEALHPGPEDISRGQAVPTEAGAASTFFAGVDVVASTGVAPNALLAGSPYLGWRGRVSGALEPSGRASFVRAGGVSGIAGGEAAFTWTVGRFDACPVALHWESIGATACARLEGGALEVAGRDVAAPQTRTRAWFAAGPLARAEWSLLKPLYVDAELGALFRATDDRFFFLPDTTVYRVPVVGLTVAAGLGSHFL